MQRRTAVYFDPIFLRHNPGLGHPECKERLESILSLLERVPIPGVELRAARPATDEEIGAVHSPSLRAMLKGYHGHRARIDPDTALSPDSYAAAVMAAGAAVAAVEEVMGGQADNAFALVRPPGHHAEPSRSMGFCLYNNVAVAAEAARRQGASRVLILDWDVHHGNGTQACFYGRRDVLYMSSHQFPFYPGTGAPNEVGTGDGAGFTVNCALPAGQGDADFGAVFHDLFLPIAEQFRPDLVLLSAGFDAHADDPLGGMRATERGFAAMCARVMELAGASCGGKVVALLEGGYSLEGLSQSVHAVLEVMAGKEEEFPSSVGVSASRAVRESRGLLQPFWTSLR